MPHLAVPVRGLPHPELRAATLPAAVLLAALAIVALGAEPAAVPALYLAVATPALVSADVLERRLPNGIVLPGYGAAAVGVAGEWIRTGEPPVLSLLCGAVTVVVIGGLAFAGGIGMGDAKLAGVLAFTAGLMSGVAAVVAPVAAVLIGGALAIAPRQSRTALSGRARGSIPFGPCLLAGFWLAVVLERHPAA
jgi:leader peptidase (prepilin peptidase)/N-methyltransferase